MNRKVVELIYLSPLVFGGADVTDVRKYLDEKIDLYEKATAKHQEQQEAARVAKAAAAAVAAVTT